MHYSDIFRERGSGFEEVFTWTLELCRSELKGEALRPIIIRIFEQAERYSSISSLKHILTILDTDIDAAAEPSGFSLLHKSIEESSLSSCRFKFMKSLVDLGANVHRVGYGIPISSSRYRIPGLQSPTTIAMRQSASFFCWCSMLREKEFCLDSFVIEELQESPLSIKGWTKDTLRDLFEYDFEPYRWRWKMMYCRHCGSDIKYRCELPWEKKLEMIKQGRIVEVQELDDRSRD
jgi:hypothetical protein